MKKLILLFSVLCLFISCANNNTQQEEPKQEEQQKSIPRSEWDSENIAYTNTTDITTGNYYYPRIEGTNGIVGTFHLEEEHFEGRSGAMFTYHYEFNENGYCYSYEKGWETGVDAFHNKVFTKPYEYKGTSRYRITKFADDYFKLDYLTDEGELKSSKFFQVSDKGLYLTYAVNRNGKLIYANPQK